MATHRLSAEDREAAASRVAGAVHSSGGRPTRWRKRARVVPTVGRARDPVQTWEADEALSDDTIRQQLCWPQARRMTCRSSARTSTQFEKPSRPSRRAKLAGGLLQSLLRSKGV
jgi:hypothetical protein